MEETTSFFEKAPMPLAEFLGVLKKLSKEGKWKIFQAATKKRKEYFESRGIMDKF